jgi:hypothetical protein
MSRLQQTWNETCERLGVKPRQFAVLLTVLTVAVSGLGLRMMMSGRPSRAVAAASRPAKAATPVRASAPQPPVITPVAATMPVTEVSLESEPARDPFQAWDAPAQVRVAEATPVVPDADVEPGVLPGMMLKAVVKGELAVIGDHTVRKGQSVLVGDQAHAKVMEIGDRSVTVLFEDRLIELALGGMPEKPAKAAAGGFR